MGLSDMFRYVQSYSEVREEAHVLAKELASLREVEESCEEHKRYTHTLTLYDARSRGDVPQVCR